MQKHIDDLDPAKKRLAFIGWPESVSAEDRLVKLEAFLNQHASSFRITECGNFYSGPYDNRKLGRVSYAEFSSPAAAKKALAKLEGIECKFGSTVIDIKLARTKLKSQRNFALRKAHELIKSSPLSQGKSVEDITWTERSMNVNGVPAFKQNKSEFGGSFLPPYSDVALP